MNHTLRSGSEKLDLSCWIKEAKTTSGGYWGPMKIEKSYTKTIFNCWVNENFVEKSAAVMPRHVRVNNFGYNHFMSKDYTKKLPQWMRIVPWELWRRQKVRKPLKYSFFHRFCYTTNSGNRSCSSYVSNVLPNKEVSKTTRQRTLQIPLPVQMKSWKRNVVCRSKHILKRLSTKELHMVFGSKWCCSRGFENV